MGLYCEQPRAVCIALGLHPWPKFLVIRMNNDPMKVIKAGETWYEAPGCHHRISDNASKTEPATLFATLVLDTDVLERDGMGALIQIDEEYR